MKRVLDLTIGERLAIGFGASAILLLLLLGLSQHWTRQVTASRHTLNTVVLPQAAAASRLETATLYVGLAVRTYVLTRDPIKFEAYERAMQTVRDELQKLGELAPHEEGLLVLQRLAPLLDEYERTAKQLTRSSEGAADVQQLEPEMTRAREELLRAIREYASIKRTNVSDSQAAVTATVERMDSALRSVGALMLMLLALTGWLTTKAVRTPAHTIVTAARRLATGEYDAALDMVSGGVKSPRDELAALSHYFGKMGLALRAREAGLRASAALSRSLAVAGQADHLSLTALETIVGYLGVEVGAIYLLDEDGMLRRKSAIGLGASEQAFEIGEGIPGRAAQSMQTVSVSDIPADSPFRIRLGVDELPPHSVAAVPMMLQNRRVMGVLLVSSVRPIPSESIEFLEHAATQLAVGIQSALGHERVRVLARELQDKNETLQAQNEEIQAQHEELQSQNEELHAQGEELQAQSEELRRTVERLAANEELLRAADKNKNEFLAVLSHELRNPLAAIKNSLYIVNRAKSSSEQAARAQAIIERQVAQLTRLVEDLLDVTRISCGKMQLQRTSVELGALLQQAAEDGSSEFANRGIEFAVNVPCSAVVRGDSARISQVVGNLLQNAAKFTPRGGRVTLALETSDGKAQIRVRDTGAGMDADTLGRLFQHFMQAEVTLARTNGGLGLGLALVKGIVELHGGSIQGNSSGRGQGSEFVVTLPLGGDDALVGVDSQPTLRPTPRRVLIVEDNADAANSLREVLAFGGHEVDVAHRGAEGLDKARAWCPDVLLCDIGLPDMDGLEVARAFRQDPRLKQVFLVALSGYAQAEDIKRASSAGFHEYLAKPPSIERLEALLSAIPAPAVRVA